MKATTRSGLFLAAVSLAATMANAGDQTHVGPGNGAATSLAQKSPIADQAEEAEPDLAGVRLEQYGAVVRPSFSFCHKIR